MISTMTVNKIKITLIRRYNARGPWRNEYYFQRHYGPKNQFIWNISEIILPPNVLFTKEELNTITKMFNRIVRLIQPKQSRK